MKILIAFCMSLLLFSCSKNDEVPDRPSDQIVILSFEATHRNIKAWDTTTITVVAEGQNLEYFWEANHGDIKGQGMTVKYAAGNCCIGLNTITCKVFNETGFAEDTIQIRVRHYLDGGQQ